MMMMASVLLTGLAADCFLNPKPVYNTYVICMYECVCMCPSFGTSDDNDSDDNNDDDDDND